MKEMVEEFSEITNLKKAYEETIKLDLKLDRGKRKDLWITLEEKSIGNGYSAEKKYKEALGHYNKGILYCPQDSDVSREILCLLLGNRSLINYLNGEYDKVFDDIDYIEEVGNYPSHLKYKLFWREARCYVDLGEFESADKAFDDALACLRSEGTEIEDEERVKHIKDIENSKKNKKPKTKKAKPQSKVFRDVEKFKGSRKFLCASPLIDIKYDEHQGRYAVATKDLPIGSLIIKEDPHAAVVEKDRSLINCQYCLAYVDNPVACADCTNVIFCSTVCKYEAEKSFHGVECSIYECVSKASNKLLALRLITQRPYTFFREQMEKLTNLLDVTDLGPTKKDVYKYDDYDNVLLLYRDIRPTRFDELYFRKAVYLLRLLKTTGYFPWPTEEDCLFDEELFIGRLIMRHYKLMSYNAHGINELKHLDYSPCHQPSMENDRLYEAIGTGLYPTLSLFNHSCEASIIRYNDKKTVIVRTIKPLKAGDIIYDNYGPNYLFMPVENRQKILKEAYAFDCVCTPCVESWPTFDKLEREVKVPCKGKNCDFVFTLTNKKRPKRCRSCRRIIQGRDVKEVTEAIKRVYDEAEKLFHEKKFNEALKSYKAVLEIKYKNHNRPDLDIVKVQERIEHIHSRTGNVNPSLKL
ncbi:hypothetical protein JTB14_021033 [Gonioctena quinquepunctata]|nr:hypothetical protein JTB14_021033 [Gonioctena quinquepunctata]